MYANRRLFIVMFTALVATCLAFTPESSLSAEDKNAIRTTIERYRTAWLANDAVGVLKTFTEDAVLLPAHGSPAVVGKAAIEKFWFSVGGPPVTIAELSISVDEVGGAGDVAFARGRNSLTWTTTERGITHRHHHSGTYLDVLKRQPDGYWRLRAHMWDEGPEQVE